MKVCLGASTTLLLSACEGEGSILDPAGPAAERIVRLFWILHVPAIVVFVVVMLLLAAALLRGRRHVADHEIERAEPPWADRFIFVSGVVIPTIVLVGVFVWSLRDMDALSSPADATALEIEVEARDWWWKVSYPGTAAVTANEIHIPTGEPVRIALTTGDVIHSFWVPRLQVKMDTVNGTTNHLWLQADEPGTYRGQCAEFCGLQHANMIFYVVAHERPEFESWLANESGPADIAAASEGLEVFTGSTCLGCHAIRGTEADSDVGPDLTHLASRSTIGAGILPNTRSNLEALIVEPHEVKPGIAMPPTAFSSDELDALLDFLEGLD
ncbi:MAG: cytochrome c oxidase subunit II [Actinomycetota bacterium]